MTDKQAILDYMQRGGWITQNESDRFIGCKRLAARICELKKDGHNIIAENIMVPKRDGKTAVVKRYTVLAPLAQGALPI